MATEVQFFGEPELAARFPEELVQWDAGQFVEVGRQVAVEVLDSAVGSDNDRVLVHVVEQVGQAASALFQAAAVQRAGPIGDDDHLVQADRDRVLGDVRDDLLPYEVPLVKQQGRIATAGPGPRRGRVVTVLQGLDELRHERGDSRMASPRRARFLFRSRVNLDLLD